jgi:hypothetical protein
LEEPFLTVSGGRSVSIWASAPGASIVGAVSWGAVGVGIPGLPELPSVQASAVSSTTTDTSAYDFTDRDTFTRNPYFFMNNTVMMVLVSK